MLKWIDILRFANNGNLAPGKRVEKTEDEWKAALTAEQFRITRQKGTERAHSSDMCERIEAGKYACVCCDTPLFDSEEKFQSGTGWPSFTQPVKENVVAYHKDRGFGMYRIETVCSTCDAHLGHVFQDGPPPSGLRFCINALALKNMNEIQDTENLERLNEKMKKLKKAYIAGGCFWGMEDLFRVRPGVRDTEVGYLGGVNDNPTYGNHPGHAEGIEITYDSDETSFKSILDYFFRIHNPTTVDRQGNDIGSSYRSTIFFQDEEEKTIAKEIIKIVDDSNRWGGKTVTTLEPFTKFWDAEPYHQDYLVKKPNGYTCHSERFGTFL